ncbi:hypothetical protein ACFWUP_22420 [Nocardia sp. NPDC058658]|uniref:hypothetical protein n=1 Tax=Nocardia sp. NPDC058658 TaxID=3346580 RepID=UPI00365C5618
MTVSRASEHEVGRAVRLGQVDGVPVGDQPILGQVIAFAETVAESVEGMADPLQRRLLA